MDYNDKINSRMVLYLLKEKLELTIGKLYEYISKEYPSINIDHEKKNFMYINNYDGDVDKLILEFIIYSINSTICYNLDDDEIQHISNNLDIFFDISEMNNSILIEINKDE